MNAFGLRWFQLYILAFMPYSDQVRQVLERLDATWNEAQEILASSAETDLGKMHHKADVEISMLGEPEFERGLTADEIPTSDRLKNSKVLGFRLPAFPDFAYLVNVAEIGYAWGQRLGRWPDAASPHIDTLEDLQPWAAVKSEALRAVTGAKKVDEFSYYELYEGAIRQRATGEPVEVLLEFDVELLQWAKPASEIGER